MDLLRFFRSSKKGSKSTAKERLQLVLVHDRAGMSPVFLEKLKEEIMQVISKYIEIEQDEFNIELTRVKSDEGDRVVPALVANIPFNKMKPGAVEISEVE